MIFQTGNLYLFSDGRSFELSENDLLICGYTVEEVRSIIESNDEPTLKEMAKTRLKSNNNFFVFEGDNQSYPYAYLLEKNPPDEDECDDEEFGWEN